VNKQVYTTQIIYIFRGSLWQWSPGSLIYNYLWNQRLSILMLWVRISIRERCTTLCDQVCQWLGTGRWFSTGSPISYTNNTDCHDITELLLKVALSTIKQTSNTFSSWHPGFSVVHFDFYFSEWCTVPHCLSFWLINCRLLFVFLYFYFSPLCFLFFVIRILITSLVAFHTIITGAVLVVIVW
jgi:hypothetical protein